jgi:hypothetical protein
LEYVFFDHAAYEGETMPLYRLTLTVPLSLSVLLVITACSNSIVSSAPANTVFGANKPFSFEIDSQQSVLEVVSDNDTYSVDGVPSFVKRDQLILNARDGKSINTVIQSLGGKVIEQESIFEDEPVITGSKADGTYHVKPPTKKKYLPCYLIEVPAESNEDLSELPRLAERAGIHGHFVFLSKRFAVLYKKMLKTRVEHSDILVSASLNGVLGGQAGTVEGGLYPSGSNETSPNTTNFWWTRPGTGSTPKGANINNGSTEKIMDFSTAAGVKVAILDSGFQGSSETVTPYNIVAGNEIEYDTVGNDTDVTGATTNPNTAPWHGRAVASNVFAPYGNSGGTLGTASGATPYLIHTDYSDMNNKQGVDQCIAWGVKIINMSFGGPNSSDNVNLQDSIRIATDYNSMIVVAAAGNNGDRYEYPASFTNVISVGAHDQSGNKSVWGSQQSNSFLVDIWAPGTSIASATVPGEDSTKFKSWNGTSFAAPIVTGALACAVAKGYVSNSSTAASRLANKGHLYNSVGRSLDALATVKP